MSYFCFDKETEQIWITPDLNKSDIINISYASVFLSDSFYKLTPLVSDSFSLQNNSEFIVLNSEIVDPPCSFCNKNLTRIFSSGNCSPCSFNLMEPYDKYELPFEKEKLEYSLIEKGYIRTSSKMFLKSIFRAQNSI